jgi:hypothetical protein
MKRVGLAVVLALAAVCQLPTDSAVAEPTPGPTPTAQEVPQPSSCAQYRQRVRPV